MNDPERKSEIESHVLSIIESAAKNGEPCPNNWIIANLLNEAMGQRVRSAGGVPAIVQNLVRQGRITVHLYGQNQRQVEILDGDCTGLKTKAPTHGKPPYVTIDQKERIKRDNSPKW